MREAPSTFVRAMCKILPKHNEQMKEIQEWQAKMHNNTTEERYPEKWTQEEIIEWAEVIALIKKFIYN